MACLQVDVIRLNIFKYCHRSDLLKIALTCRKFYDEIKPYLWHQVRINARYLHDLPLTVERTRYLRYTRHLAIADDTYFNRHSYLPALHYVLAECNTKTLKSLSVTNLNGPNTEVLLATPFRFVNLTKLCLRNINIPSANWTFVFEFKLLTCLEVVSSTTLPNRGCNIDQCNGLKKLTKLTQLTWYGCECDLDIICNLKSLRKLTLGLHHSFSPDGIDSHTLSNLTNLVHLDFKDSFYVDDSLFSHAAELVMFRRLEYLGVNQTNVTNGFILHIASLRWIKHLDIGRTEITEESFLLLTRFTNLISLRIRCIKLSEVGIAFISSTFGSLQELDISGCLSENSDIRHLTKLTYLQTLFIEESIELSDDCLQHVAMIPSLKKLYMGWNRFTDAGLLYLTNIGLKYLNVEDCDDISDEGLKNASLDAVVSYG